MTTENDTFESELAELARKEREQRDIKRQESNTYRGHARRCIEIAREERELKREMEWIG